MNLSRTKPITNKCCTKSDDIFVLFSHKFVEGWVEFLSKKTARRVAEQVNGKEGR